MRWTLPWALVLGLAGVVQPAGSRPAQAADAQPSAIQLGAVALPVVVDGRLINYVFVTVRLELSPSADGSAVRNKEPFFRDALVRAAHRPPFFTLANDYTRLDDRRIRAEVLSDAVVILGRGVVANATVVKQVSQHHSNLPPTPNQARRPELVP
jgi:hypothetical protein